MSAIVLPHPRPLWTPPRLRVPSATEVFAWLQRDPTRGAGKRNATTGAGIRGTAENNVCCCEGEEPGPAYIRAKRCDTLASVDLWFDYDSSAGQLYDPVGAAWRSLPFYFSIGSVRYFANGESETADTAGTMASGYTIRTGCGTCSGCTGEFAAGWDVTFDGISYCGCDNSFLRGFAGATGGTFRLPTPLSGSCGSGVQGPNVQYWNYDTGCTNPLGPGEFPTFIQLNANVGDIAWVAREGVGPFFFYYLFYGTFAAGACAYSGTVGNNNVCYTNPTSSGLAWAIATGGTATITPITT